MDYGIVSERDGSSERVDALLRQAAGLHFDALSYRSFITGFGREFLYQLHKAILEHGIGFMVYASEGGGLKGFIIGCPDGAKVMSVIPKRFGTFARLIVPRLVKNPGLAFRLFETVLYPAKEGKDTKAELLVIATEDASRSRGVGTAMLEKLADEFRRQGVSEYRVTVHKEMERANNFYRKNGMRLSRTFSMYGMPWNVYHKEINTGEDRA